MKKLTLDTLAKMAGVGVATVDRVLNERGGVSPETTRKVLRAAKEAGLNRTLPEERKSPWQVEVILSSNDTYFFHKLATDFSKVASALGYRRLTLHRTLVSEAQPEKLAQHIIKSSAQRDGIIVFAPNHPAIYDALAQCKKRGLPVITLVTDLPKAQRLCHVGIDQLQAGRTAGLLMAKMLSQPGEVLVVSGRIDFIAHQHRVEGFKQVLKEKASNVRLREVLAGEDHRETLRRLLEQNLAQSRDIIGIYNTGDVNTEVSEALARHKLQGKCRYITHELYDLTRKLLENDILSFTLDQNARQHAGLALKLLLRALEESYQPDIYADGKVEFKVMTAENMD